MPTARLESLFPWDTLHAMIGGESALDVPNLDVHSEADAESFLECYGFLWASAAHRAEVEAIRMAAWTLLEEELLPGTGLVPPREIRNQRKIPRLLLQASIRPITSRQRWSCALLRVMHIVAHVQSGMNARFGPEVRSQVLDRFQPHLIERGDQLHLGRDDSAIPLVSFDFKHGKPMRSLAMKLLHKAENVADDVFDRLGVRIVTRDRLDTLLVVRYLRSHNVVMFANVKPSRARNTLVDLDQLREAMRALDQQIAGGDVERAEAADALRGWVEEQAYPGSSTEHNRHSSTDYHSIQITCRRLIRIPTEAGELRFFFPFEIQIMDARSWEATQTGRAAHTDYKDRQRASARQRVLRDLLRDELPRIA